MDSSNLDPNLIHASVVPHESAPKRHLDLYNHFAELTKVTNTQTDRPTATTLLRL